MSERRRSAPGADSDPFQVWREWVDQAERQLNSALAEMMESERFGKSSGRMLDLLMGFQSTMSSATQRYFSTLNLPTRTDVLQLGDRLASIEERLALIEQAVAALGPESTPRRGTVAAPRPRRTKKPPPEAEPADDTAATAVSKPAGKKASTARKKKAAARKRTTGKAGTKRKARSRRKSGAKGDE